jgi:hypothetical protein
MRETNVMRLLSELRTMMLVVVVEQAIWQLVTRKRIEILLFLPVTVDVLVGW